MAVPIAAILYKLRVTYPSYKFEIKPNHPDHTYIVYVYKQSELLGSKAFKPETPMDAFWIEIKSWMRTIVR